MLAKYPMKLPSLNRTIVSHGITLQFRRSFDSHEGGEHESRALDIKSIDRLEFKGDRPTTDLESKNNTIWNNVLYKGIYDAPCEANPQLCVARLLVSIVSEKQS
jgi:hypothetical protein